MATITTIIITSTQAAAEACKKRAEQQSVC